MYGLVWTPLYAGIAVTSAVVLDELAEQDRTAERCAFVRALCVRRNPATTATGILVGRAKGLLPWGKR